MQQLKQRRIAILVTDGFEESELTEPKKALEAAGAKVDVISPDRKEVRSWSNQDWGKKFPVDKGLGEVDASEYDGLVLPGGVMNPDKLRINQKAVTFVKNLFSEGKPIAAICHGPWTLIETGGLSGRRVTSYPSLKTDLVNAGAEWFDKEVVVDEGLVTSRRPGDLPAFCEKMIEEFKEGIHEKQKTA